MSIGWLLMGLGSAAKARTFHFPLDTQTGEEIARIPEQRGVTVQHTNANNNVPVVVQTERNVERIDKKQESTSQRPGKQEQEDPNFLTRRSGTSAEASELECNGRKTGKAKTEGKRSLQDSLRKRQELTLHPEVTNNAIFDTQTRKANERTRCANGEASLIFGGAQGNGHVGHQTGRNGRKPRLEPMERNLRFCDFRKCVMEPGNADFAFEKISDPGNKKILADLNSDSAAEVKKGSKVATAN